MSFCSKATALAVMGILLAAGCSTTRVTNSWTAPMARRGAPPEKTLVVALFPNEAARRTLEGQLALELRKEGVTALPASDYIEDPAELDRAELQRIAEQNGFDAVVMSRFVGTRYDFERVYTGAGLGPGVFGFGSYSPFFGFRGSYLFAPDYVYPEKEALVETSLFNAEEDGKLLWSATSETVDPKNSVREMKAIADKVVEQMDEDAVI